MSREPSYLALIEAVRELVVASGQVALGSAEPEVTERALDRLHGARNRVIAGLFNLPLRNQAARAGVRTAAAAAWAAVRAAAKADAAAVSADAAKAWAEMWEDVAEAARKKS